MDNFEVRVTTLQNGILMTSTREVCEPWGAITAEIFYCEMFREINLVHTMQIVVKSTGKTLYSHMFIDNHWHVEKGYRMFRKVLGELNELFSA